MPFIRLYCGSATVLWLQMLFSNRKNMLKKFRFHYIRTHSSVVPQRMASKPTYSGCKILFSKHILLFRKTEAGILRWLPSSRHILQVWNNGAVHEPSEYIIIIKRIKHKGPLPLKGKIPILSAWIWHFIAIRVLLSFSRYLFILRICVRAFPCRRRLRWLLFSAFKHISACKYGIRLCRL